MSKPVDLEALATLEKAATPGKWEHGGSVFVDGVDTGNEWVWSYSPVDPETGSTEEDTRLFDASPADAALIVALRNAAPAMIQELRELRAFFSDCSGAKIKAERDALHASRDEWKAHAEAVERAHDVVLSENDDLRVELLRVRDRLDEFNQNDKPESDCVGNLLQTSVTLRAELELTKSAHLKAAQIALDFRAKAEALRAEVEGLRAANEKAQEELGHQDADLIILRAQLATAREDAERLRALVKHQTLNVQHTDCGEPSCPWCGGPDEETTKGGGA